MIYQISTQNNPLIEKFITPVVETMDKAKMINYSARREKHGLSTEKYP